MNVTSVGLLHLSPEAEARLRQAAEQCFTQVNWIPLDQWPVPTSSQGAILDLVVCSGMVPVDLFAQTEGPQTRPPWPLIILGSTDSRRGVRGIPQADVEAWVLAEAIRSVVTEFALLRQIEDLQGDLLTIGRRLNHDLRSPLGCVITTTESLQEVLRETVPAELLQTQFILDSAEEALQLVRRVTFLAKATATPPTPSALNMASPFQAAWESLETEALNRRATLQFPEAWPEVLGVSEWLEVIWHNLLKNALQHGGEPPVIAAGWRDLGQCWEFYLEDQGSGVPDTLRPRLFQPFQSLHQPNSAQGFGLAIVRRLCELQGGHCGFRPRQPVGSVFFFVLPQQSP